MSDGRTTHNRRIVPRAGRGAPAGELPLLEHHRAGPAPGKLAERSLPSASVERAIAEHDAAVAKPFRPPALPRW